MEPKKDKRIHGAALAFAAIDRQHKEVTERRNEARQTLLTAMDKAKKTVYQFQDETGDVSVEIQPSRSVKCVVRGDDLDQ